MGKPVAGTPACQADDRFAGRVPTLRATAALARRG